LLQHRDRRVDLVAAQALDHLRCGPLANLDLDAWVIVPEAQEELRQVDPAGREHPSDDQPPPKEAAELIDLAAERLDLREDPRRPGERDLAGLGQLDAPTAANQQVGAQLAL
jgi:hypothetical protein